MPEEVTPAASPEQEPAATPVPTPPVAPPVLSGAVVVKKRRLKRPALLILTILGIAVVGAGAAAVIAYQNQTLRPIGCSNSSCPSPTASPSTSATTTPAPTPTPVARALDGVMVTPGTESMRPLAVMIENHPDARPQSGLAAANWVYEAIAEGGITRFMAMYANPQTADTRVGPVRSVRTYYLDFAREYSAYLGHVGGNIDALDDIVARGGVINMDQFAIGEPTYKRDFSRNVALEHTMYSTTGALWNYIIAKGYDTKGNVTALPFVDDATAAARPASQNVTIDFSEASFAVRWAYDPTTNSYTRYMAGAVHKDAVTGAAITAKNIILETVAKEAVTTRINEHGWRYTLTGTGKVVVVQNGVAITGTWKRDGNNRTRYYKADGTEISLVRGTTWVEVVHTDVPTTY